MTRPRDLILALTGSPKKFRNLMDTPERRRRTHTFKWLEGPIYKFSNKNKEDSMRRASAWLSDHPRVLVGFVRRLS